MDAELDPEDAKIITLARATRARGGAASGAAVRDDTGRTYAAVDVALESVSLSALQLAVAMAYSSGGTRLEAAAVVTGADVDGSALDAAWELGAAHVLVAGPDGAVLHAHLNPQSPASA